MCSRNLADTASHITWNATATRVTVTVTETHCRSLTQRLTDCLEALKAEAR